MYYNSEPKWRKFAKSGHTERDHYILPRLTVRRREDVLVGDEDSSALVLREKAEQGGLLDEDLPRPVAELGLCAADDTAFAANRPNTAI